MKLKYILMGVAVVVVAGAVIFGYTQMSEERKAEAEADHPVSAASRVQTGVNGETVITLDAQAQRLIGLQTVPLAAATLPAEIRAYGRVLDSAALVALHSDADAARAALQASKPEYRRLKQLSTQDNASARALEAAEAQMKHDQGALDTARAQLVAASSKAALAESSDFFESLAKQESVLVRLDLPVGESIAAPPTGAQLILPETSQPIAADYLGRAAAADPQAQGVGFIFVVTNAAALTPGLSITGDLQLPGKSASGAIVPDASLVRSDGRVWIFVQTSDTTFTRREIAPEHPAAGGWFVTNGVAPGDKVVVIGAQTLLSEEHKSEIQMGD